MILTDSMIDEAIRIGKLTINPLRREHIGPASIDLTLSNYFLWPVKPETGVLSLREPIDYVDERNNKIVIPSRGFVLASTEEAITLGNNITGFVEGRSSVGRAGLFIQNAGWIDPGFIGRITLELFNANNYPLEIEAGWRICQLVVAQSEWPALKPYCGKYQGQDETTGSRSYEDKENGI